MGQNGPMSTKTYDPIAPHTVAFLGLGVMGYPMAGHLARAGHRVTVYNRTAAKAAQWVAEYGGQSAPTFGTRKLTTRLRMREGESNLLAGLLREEDRRSLAGFPGLLRLPVFKQFLSNNDQQITQTDIVMLLTPHIVRTHELTADDLSPIYIGTQQNLGLGGPPPLIASSLRPWALSPTMAFSTMYWALPQLRTERLPMLLRRGAPPLRETIGTLWRISGSVVP